MLGASEGIYFLDAQLFPLVRRKLPDRTGDALRVAPPGRRQAQPENMVAIVTLLPKPVAIGMSHCL